MDPQWRTSAGTGAHPGRGNNASSLGTVVVVEQVLAVVRPMTERDEQHSEEREGEDAQINS